jgi:Phosphoinositide 3-kinase family, accessory domain (PIK domain)
VDILNQWEPIPFSAALELLTPSFKQAEVRAYAVSRLEPATDDQLLSFLLQLVQALRHEHGEESPLFSFLVRRAQRLGVRIVAMCLRGKVSSGPLSLSLFFFVLSAQRCCQLAFLLPIACSRRVVCVGIPRWPTFCIGSSDWNPKTTSPTNPRISSPARPRSWSLSSSAVSMVNVWSRFLRDNRNSPPHYVGFKNYCVQSRIGWIR